MEKGKKQQKKADQKDNRINGVERFQNTPKTCNS